MLGFALISAFFKDFRAVVCESSVSKLFTKGIFKSSTVTYVQVNKMNSDRDKKIKLCFLSVNKEQADSLTYLKGIEDFVGLYRHDEIRVKNQFTWTIGPFEDTIFKDNREMLENWQARYLPKHMMMQVLGTIKKNGCEPGCLQVVLMVCEDMKLYAYHEMEMHLVADNLQELFDQGISFPGKEIFDHGQRFNKMTEEEWKVARESDEMKKVDEEHTELLESLLPEFKALMAAFDQNQSEMMSNEVTPEPRCPRGSKRPKPSVPPNKTHMMLRQKKNSH